MLKIGPIELDSLFVQAALSGYSDAPMRVIARRMGCPYAIHEVVLDKLVLQPGKFQRQLVRIPVEDHPLGGQLMGAEPELFGAAARFMAEAGFDAIDINFGCPVKKVLGRCRGGYLLSDPATAIEIIRRVRDAVPPDKPVTLKMRRGMDDSAAAERNFFTIFDAAIEHGLAAICVHGRTVQQRYVGPSRWDFLERVRRYAPGVTLLGSGDVFTAEDAVRMLETGVDGVWIARGCIGNPWIFREAQALWRGVEAPPPPSVAEQGRVIREHFELAAAWEGEATAARTMRKFGIRYSMLHPAGLAVRDAFIRCRTAAEWRAVLDEWYAPQRDWPVVDRASRRAQLMAAGAGLAECG